ncbi:MAG: FkbM family methyltransferase [bacterium]
MFFKKYVLTIPVRDQGIRLSVTNVMEYSRARTYASKEPETIEWFHRYFRPGSVYYDIGANIGLYSLYPAKLLSQDVRIISIEPASVNFHKLNLNVYLNSLAGVISSLCVAVSDREEIGEFALGDLTEGSALHSYGEAVDYMGNPFQPLHQYRIFSTTLDSLHERWGLPFPNHIKIDVDGIERKIIEGAPNTLADPRLQTVLVEITDKGDSVEYITSTMKKEGFRIDDDFSEHSSELLKGTPYEKSRNFIFVRDLK